MIEKTLVLLKPDTIQRNLVGQIISRLENTGLKIIALKMTRPDDNLTERHYRLSPEWVKDVAAKTRKAHESKGKKLSETDKEIAKRIQTWLKDYLKEGPVLAIVFEGPHAVEIVRKIVGNTEPRSSLPGTIRGDFMVDSYQMADYKKRPLRNLIHASGTREEAQYEIPIWFKPEELHEYISQLDKYFKHD